MSSHQPEPSIRTPYAIPGMDRSIHTVRTRAGEYVLVVDLARAFNLDAESEARKLRAEPWAFADRIEVVDSHGVTRSRDAIPAPMVAMWLTTLDPAGLERGLQARLLGFQEKAAAVLAAAFSG